MKLIPSNGISIGDRAEQQDDFGFSDPLAETFVAHGGVLAVVVDGMGGVQFGAESARIAKAAFLHAYEAKTAAESIGQALDRALYEANAAVVAAGRAHGNSKSVGATLTAAVVWRDTLTWISVGDSALFILSQGVLQRLTTAHEIIDPVQGPFVLSFLGLESLTQIDRPTAPVPLSIGDRVLVCSDGLFKSCSETDISRVLLSAPPAQLASDLVDYTIGLSVSGQDNITALVMCCEPEGTPSPITSNVPVRRSTKRYVAAAAVVLFLIGGASLFAWSRYATEYAGQIADAYAAGNCPAVLRASGSLKATRWPLDTGTSGPIQACTEYDVAVKDGDKAMVEATAATRDARVELLQAAADAFARALKKLPIALPTSGPAADVAAKLKAAQDALRTAGPISAPPGPSADKHPKESKDADNGGKKPNSKDKEKDKTPLRPNNSTDDSAQGNAEPPAQSQARKPAAQ